MSTDIKLIPTNAYKLGYSKTPKRTRFKSGRFAISKARQKKVSNEGDEPMLALMLERWPAIMRGKRAKLPTYRLLLQTYVQRAFEGDHKAMTMLLKMTNNFANVRREERQQIYFASPEYKAKIDIQMAELISSCKSSQRLKATL